MTDESLFGKHLRECKHTFNIQNGFQTLLGSKAGMFLNNLDSLEIVRQQIEGRDFILNSQVIINNYSFLHFATKLQLANTFIQAPISK